MILPSAKIRRLHALNRYYRITKFYPYLLQITLKTGIFLGLLVLVFLLADHFLPDMSALISSMANKYSGWILFPVFFFSESFLGLLPPDLFIAWSSQTRLPFMNLAGLATLSYFGGIMAYYCGKMLYHVPKIAYHLEKKMSGNIIKLKRWGGLFVFMGAMLPLPHSLVSLACGLIHYNRNYYLFWALFRFPRFFIYALLIYNIQ